MSFQTEHRGFTVGREIGICGRCTRFVLGLLGLVSIGIAVAKIGPSATLFGLIAMSLLLTVALYLVLFRQLGERVSHPWLLTLMFWLPAAFILLPWDWGLGVLLYWSVACLLAALSSYGGGAGGGVSRPPLSTIHGLLPAQCHRLVERRYTQR